MKKPRSNLPRHIRLYEVTDCRMRLAFPQPPLTINYTQILKMDGYNAFEKQTDEKEAICCKTATDKDDGDAILRNGTK